jgi:hypothetical protein
MVPFGAIADGAIAEGDVLALRVFTRIGTTGAGYCGGHNNPTGLRLYFDTLSRKSAFTVTLDGP